MACDESSTETTKSARDATLNHGLDADLFTPDSHRAQDARPAIDVSSQADARWISDVQIDSVSDMVSPTLDTGRPLDMTVIQDASIGDMAPMADLEFMRPDAQSPRPIDVNAAPCRGLDGAQCLNGYTCVDDPRDGCNPDNGAAACPGFCMPTDPEGCPTPRRCNSRIVEYCDDGEFIEESVCERSERCINARCVALPNAYGMACTLVQNQRSCLRAGLVCAGRAVVPFCLHPDSLDEPIGLGGECYGDRDCARSYTCNREGRCADNGAGNRCRENEDCQNDCEAGVCN